jgi:ribonuclease VapC
VIALDTSALVAIALDEPERIVFARAIADNRCLIALPTALEAHIVLRRQLGADGIEFLQDVLNEPSVVALDFSQELFVAAREAFDRYGKGRHRAALNFGDCISYAVAKARDVPLLYKGQDFALTDINAALP